MCSQLPSFDTRLGVCVFVLRLQAVEAINKVVMAMPSAHVMEHYVVVLRRLATKDWFTSRISACGLFATAYQRVPAATLPELRALFAELCR